MSDESSGEVRISPQKVYEEVLGMKESLGKIESFMEKHIALQEQTNAGIEVRLENHGTRLGNHDTDITNLRSDVTAVQSDIKLLKEVNAARDQRRTPWWVWITAGGALIAAGGGAISLWLQLDRLAALYSQLP